VAYQRALKNSIFCHNRQATIRAYVSSPHKHDERQLTIPYYRQKNFARFNLTISEVEIIKITVDGLLLLHKFLNSSRSQTTIVAPNVISATLKQKKANEGCGLITNATGERRVLGLETVGTGHLLTDLPHTEASAGKESGSRLVRYSGF
jgi:hypothetical protein